MYFLYGVALSLFSVAEFWRIQWSQDDCVKMSKDQVQQSNAQVCTNGGPSSSENILSTNNDKRVASVSALFFFSFIF